MSLFYRPYPAKAPTIDAPILVEINAQLVPIILSALERYKYPQFWASQQDYINGFQQLEELQRELLMGAANVERRLDDIYRLLNTTFNGQVYEETAPGVVSPEIPAVPEASTTRPNALRAHIGRLQQLAENAATGATYPAGAGIQGSPALPADLAWAARLLALQGTSGGFFGLGAAPTTLTSLLQASRINNAADQGLINNNIEEVLQTVAAGGNIGTALSNLFGTGIGIATDGGLAAITIAAAVANATIGATQLKLMQRLIKSIDGGDPLTPVTDNILLALRGTSAATEDRNALDYLRKIAITGDGEEEAANLLQDIRDKIDGLRSALVGNDDTNNVVMVLNRLETLLKGLVDVDDMGAPVTGPTLQIFNDLLNCICEGVTGTPDTTLLNPEPTTACGVGFPAWVRTTRLTAIDVVENENGERFGVYAVEFPLGAPYNISAEETYLGRYIYKIAVDVNVYEFCDAWDFTGKDLPYSRYILQGAATRANITGPNQPFFNESSVAGMFSSSIDTTLPGTNTNEFTVIYFWREGEVASRNIFFTGKPE